MQHTDFIEPLWAITQQAGAKIMPYYHAPEQIQVELKDDQSPVTQADKAADAYICEQLNQLTPSIPILSEEMQAISFKIRKQWSRYWLVDPLDGTRGFAQGLSHFTVNIALIENHQPVMGFIYAPALEQFYWATKDKGAYASMNYQHPLKKAELQITRIVSSLHHQHPALKQIIASTPHDGLVSMGSSLKFCMLAEGKAELYPRLQATCEWDTAAAHCILREAGGEIYNLDGEPLLYNMKDTIINPPFLAVANPNHPLRHTMIAALKSESP